MKKSKNKREAPGTSMNADTGEGRVQKAGEEDARFAHIRQDPIFRRVPKDKKRVNIDSRFGAMFHDDKFKLKYKVDKRGKPMNQTSDENMKRYYNLIEDDDDAENSDKEETVEVEETPLDEPESDTDDSKSEQAEPESVNLSEKTKKKLQDLTIDYARGEGVLNSDSEEESDDSSGADSSTSEDEDEGIEDMTHAWGELDKDADRTEEMTNRLALCNMDWDRIKSDDLMVLFNSFLPPGGSLKCVTIFPSEFGKKRLAEEELHGPRELREVDDNENDENGEDLDSEANSDDDDDISTGFVPGEDEDGEEGSSFHMEKLRKYQLNRLKYYYAVLEFDSVETANKVYTECDGLEFESSATKVDLRFIPDELTFDEEPRDKCDKMPATEKYTPKFFTTTALQQMKVDLTWDETDPERQLLTKRVHDPKEKVDEDDLRAYLASSSDEDENNDVKEEPGDDDDSDEDAKSNVDAISKYRNLLDFIQDDEKKKKEKDVEMEITWGVGLKKTTENLVKKKLDEEKAKKMTPWEEQLAKKHEKKKMKKKLAKKDNDDEVAEDNADGEAGSNSSEEEEADKPFSDDEVDVDLNDPFFKNELELEPGKSTKKSKLKKSSKDPKKSQQEADDAAALELLLMDNDTNEGRSHFSLKKILEAEAEQNDGSKKSKKKRKKNKKKNKDEEDTAVSSGENKDNFQIDLQDDRFNSLYTSHKFNLDPSDPNYKKTKAMDAIISEKQKRRIVEPTKIVSESNPQQTVDENDDEVPTKISRKSELSSLVKSIKRNTENLKQKKSKFNMGQKVKRT